MLLNDDGSLTSRGRSIIDHTPAGRFGDPDDLIATAIWLCSPGARFVNGVVVPVDGGFSVQRDLAIKSKVVEMPETTLTPTLLRLREETNKLPH
ncbi:MAG: SDR family oxidoreductase [Anaerolineae bacterium]